MPVSRNTNIVIPKLKNKQEEHHTQAVYHLRYRQIVVVVILDFCSRLPLWSFRLRPLGLPIQSFHTVSPDFFCV